MAENEMEPAEPPEPSPRNLPFQPLCGIHTSKLMWDWVVGAAKAAMRQKAGMPANTSPSAAVKLPAGTEWAVVMVMSARESPARLSHVGPAARAAPPPNSSRAPRQTAPE